MTTKTYRAGRLLITFDKIETRGVLGGAYRGEDLSTRNTLTHLVFWLGDDELRTGCRQDVDRMADTLSATDEEKALRPTCPDCAKKWDKIKAQG